MAALGQKLPSWLGSSYVGFALNSSRLQPARDRPLSANCRRWRLACAVEWPVRARTQSAWPVFFAKLSAPVVRMLEATVILRIGLGECV